MACSLNQSVSANDPLIAMGAATDHNTNGWVVMRNLTSDFYLQINAAAGYPTDELQVYATGGSSSTWHNWAVSYDGSKAASGVTFYRDQASSATTVGADNLSGDASPAANRLYVAGDIGGATLNGKIGQIMVFNRELTSSEMGWVTGNIMLPAVSMARVFG